jgi:signal transduction histidine kinase/DNA-binding NarL/FixJ family response regulator
LQIDPSAFIGNTNAEISIIENKEITGAIIHETDDQVLHGETVEYEIEHRICGNWITFHIIKTPIRDRHGNITSICGICRDVTERRRMEEDLIRARKLESVGILAGGIAHDFNNLLAAIQGYVELANNTIPSENHAHNYLLAAERATMQAADLTKRLITFSRGGEPIRKPCDISALVKDTIQRIVVTIPVEKKYLIHEDVVPVMVDEGQMRQVIRNLVSNALDAMQGGGILTVMIHNVMIAHQDLLPIPEGPYVRISVGDTGIGISENDLPHIFDPYFSTKERGSQKGMGLGLAVCYSVVSQHNGYINVESKEGTGSVFHIYISAVHDHPPLKVAPCDEKQKERNRAKRILIMDDDAMVREMVCQLLKIKDYEVEKTSDGIEAIETYLKAREANSPFDLLLLDLTVKDGLGGVLTLKRLQEIDPRVKAIVFSGYADDPVIQNYQQYGFLGAIIKPFTAKVLHDAIKKIHVTIPTFDKKTLTKKLLREGREQEWENCKP